MGCPALQEPVGRDSRVPWRPCPREPRRGQGVDAGEGRRPRRGVRRTQTHPRGGHRYQQAGRGRGRRHVPHRPQPTRSGGEAPATGRCPRARLGPPDQTRTPRARSLPRRVTANVKTPFLGRLQEACDLVGAKLEVIPGSDNSGRITLPSGRVRYFHRLQWDLNTLGAAAIAVDKDATMRVLKRSGHTVPTGRSFYYVGRMREQRDIGGAYAYARRLGLPVLLKPNDSSSDQHVSVAYTRPQFYAAARAVFAASKKLLVQRIARGSDCSIVVLDGEILLASEKTRPFVLGDGRSDVRRLIAASQRRSRAAGHPTDLLADDVRVARHLAHDRQTLATVPRL